MRTYLVAAALALAPVAGARLAQAQDGTCTVRVPGHWETRRDTTETGGHWETRSKVVWRPGRSDAEQRTRVLPGHWELDVAGNRFWVQGATVTETVSVWHPGAWETIADRVWVPGATTYVERQVWVPEHFETRASGRGPWDDTPRTQPADEPSVSVEAIGGVLESDGFQPSVERRIETAPPSSERLREPWLPTVPKEPSVDPWAKPQPAQPCPRRPRDVKPLVLVDNPAPQPACPAPAPAVVYAPPAPPQVVYAPQPPQTVIVAPPPPRVIVVSDPCPPRYVVAAPCPPAVVVVRPRRCDPWDDCRWREPAWREPVWCAPAPCAPRAGVHVGVGVGFDGPHVSVGFGVRFGGHHHHGW